MVQNTCAKSAPVCAQAHGTPSVCWGVASMAVLWCSQAGCTSGSPSWQRWRRRRARLCTPCILRALRPCHAVLCSCQLHTGRRRKSACDGCWHGAGGSRPATRCIGLLDSSGTICLSFSTRSCSLMSADTTAPADILRLLLLAVTRPDKRAGPVHRCLLVMLPTQ